MNLGELIVELSADSSELEKTLERAKKKAYEAAMSVEKSFEKINLNINVDDDSLTDLNKHLNLKVQHLKEVNKYFNNNPIVVNIDDSQLTDLNKHLHIKVQHLKEVNKYYDSNPIKINTDTTRLDDLEERLGKLTNKTITITVESNLSNQLEKSLVAAVKEAVKDGMQESSVTQQQQASKEASSQNKVQNVNVVASPGRAVLEGIFDGLGKGFTQGINKGIEDAVGVDIPTMTRISSNMMLRYFGVGKKAQSDPKNEQKRVEAILKDGVDTFIKVHDANTKKSNIAPQLSTTVSQKTAVTSQPVTTLTAPTVIKSAPQQKTTVAALPTAFTNPSATTLTSPITVVAVPRKVTTTSTANKVSRKQSNLGFDDDLGVDFEAAGGSAARGLLRFFGIGKKAQSDPKEEKARIEAIIKGMVDDYSQSQSFQAPAVVTNTLSGISNTFLSSIDETLEGLGQQSKIAVSKAVRKSSQGVLNKAPAQVQKAANALFNEIEGRGGDSFAQVVGKQLATTAKSATNNLLKTILPNTYSVVKKFISTGGNISPIGGSPSNTGTSSVQSSSIGNSPVSGSVSPINYAQIPQHPSFDALGQASQNLSNAAQSLNEFTLSSKNTNVQPINQSNTIQQVATQELQTPLEIPLPTLKKSKKPKKAKEEKELELIPIENSANKIPLQLKQHIEAIQSSTSKNIELSRQYAEATANENGNELVPLDPVKAKKIEDIRVQKELSLKDVSAKFEAINNYFSKEYKQLKADVDRAKKSDSLEDINATRSKLKNFVSISKKAMADIDAAVKQAQDQGHEKYINSELTKIHGKGKSPIGQKVGYADKSIGALNTKEAALFNKDREYWVAQAKQAGMEIPEGLKQGIVSNFDGVSSETKKMLDDFIKTVETRLGIQSPSLVMFEVGMMIASGLFLGMQKGNSQVAVGARQLVSTIKSAVGSAKEILEPALAIGGVIPGVSTTATIGSVGLAATDSGLKMLDKMGERHAANPDQTLFQSAFGSGKDFITELRADKTLTKPREAFDHFINLSKAGAATLGVNSFTTFDAAQAGMTALLRSSAAGKAIVQSHGETKYRLAQDPSLDYMTTYKAILTDKLKDLKLTKPEIVKAIGSALKVVPTGFGTAANSVAETAGMVLADGIDALTIPRNLYRNISSKTAQGITHQQAIAESITDLGAPVQVANAIGSFGDKHSNSLNTFARMSGNVVENINKALINTVAASSKVVSSSTNAVSNQIKKNMGHELPGQQPVAQPSSQSISGTVVASNNVSAKPFASIGGNIMRGLGKGIADGIGSVTKVMDNAGDAIQSQIKQNMGIQSPSKVMIALGLMISSGLAIGISSGAGNVSGSMKSIIANINSGVEKYKNIKQFLSQGLDKNATNIVAQTIQSLQKDFGENSFISTELDKIKNVLESGIGKINNLFLSMPIGKGLNKIFSDIEQKITEFNQKLTSKIKTIFESSNNFKEVGAGFMSAIGQGIASSIDKLKIKVFDTFEAFFSSMMSPFVDIIARSDNFSEFGINLFSSIGQNITGSFSKIQNLIIGSGGKIKDIYKNVVLSIQSAILNSNNFKEFAINLFSPVGKTIANLSGNLLKAIVNVSKNIRTSANNIFKNFLPGTNNDAVEIFKLAPKLNTKNNEDILEVFKLANTTTGQLTGNNYNKLANLVLQLTGKTASQQEIPLLGQVDDPNFLGSYQAKNNLIRVNKENFKNLMSSDVSQLSDELIDTVLHEMFHAVQQDFGKVKLQEASKFSSSPTLKDIAKWSGHIEASVAPNRGRISDPVALANLELGAYTFADKYFKTAKDALISNTSLTQSITGAENQSPKEVQQAILKTGKAYYDTLQRLAKIGLPHDVYMESYNIATQAHGKAVNFAESLDNIGDLSPEETQKAIERFTRITDYISSIPATYGDKPVEVPSQHQEPKPLAATATTAAALASSGKLPKELQQTILTFKQIYQDISSQVKTMNLPDDLYSQAHKAIEKGYGKGTELIEVLDNIQDLSPEQANLAMEKFNQYNAYLSNIPATINKFISKPDEVVAQEQKTPVAPKANQSIQQSEFFRNIRQVIGGSANLKELATNTISAIVQSILISIRKHISSFVTKITESFTDVTDQPIEAFKQNLPQQAGQALNNTYRTISPLLPAQFQAVDIESRKWESEFNKKLNPNQSQNKFNQYIPSIPVKSTEVLTNVHRAVSPILPIQFQANDFDFHKQLNSGNSNLLNNPAVNQVVNTAKKLKSTTSFKEIGSNLISSLGQGFLSVSGGVLGIVTAFAKGILSAIKKVFRIASPSGEGIDVGENIAGSTGTGIDNQAHRAVEAARNMAEDISEAMIPDPWDMRFSANPVFQQDLDLENQAQAQIRATREHLQKSMIQGLLSNAGVNFGSDFNHEGIASSVLSSSQLIKYLNNNFANLNPFQQMGFRRLADDFDNQKTNAAHQFAIARTSGTTLDSATIRGFDSSFNTILNRIVAFSKQLGIKSTEIDRLLASNQSRVTAEVYQPPRFVAPKTSIPERQSGQTDQEYSEIVKRALAEDNNNYRAARNAYNRMILGVSDTPVPQKTQFPMLPPVPVYAREIIDNVPSVAYTTPDPWNNSVQSNLQKFVEQVKPQSILPPAKAYRDINLLLTSTQSNLQKLGRDIVSSQLRTQLPQQNLPQAFVPVSNSGVQQLLLPPAKAYKDVNLLLTSTQSNLQKLGRDIVSSQLRTQLPQQQTQLPPQRITSPLILPNSVVNNPNAKLILPKTATPRPDAQIISPQNFTANPNAQLILPVVQGLIPAVRSTHSLAQNSISTLTNTNKQIRVNLDALRSGNKNLVFSRYAPIPDPWLAPSPTAQASRQSTMQPVNRSNQLPTGQISATLPSAILSFISQNPPTAIPSYSVPTVRQNIKSIASQPPNIPPVPTITASSSQPPNIPPVPPTTASSSQPQPPNIPPTLMNQYLSLGTDLVTNMFKAVNTSIRQSTLSGYASLGQVMRNAVNAALFSLSDTLRKPLHQALMSQTRSILPWFMKFIPRGFQLLPKLSMGIPFVGGIALRFGNSIIKNLLENNILKKGGFLTNLLSSITRINLSALSGTKTAGITGFLGSIVNPVPMFVGSKFNPFLSLGLGAASPLYDAFSGILGLDESIKPNPKKQAPTVEKVLQNQTKANREKAKIRDFAGAKASKELVETLGNTLVDNVLESLDIPLIPKSAVQIMMGKKLGQRSATIADSINALGVQKSKTEQLLERAVQSGKATPERIDRLTRMALRERGIGKSARNAMTADELAVHRENILKNSLDATKRERDFLQFEGDLEANTTKRGFDATKRTRDAKLIRILRERGVSNADIRNIRQSSNGLNDVAADLVNNPRTTNKGFVGKLTEAYAANDQDAMKELVKQGLRKTGMSSKQIDNINPKLLDTATAGIMTTLSGLQAKFKEKGFNMGKALAKGFKDSMVNLANAKDDLEYNAKKALGQANFGDSVGLIFRRMFRGTVATQDQFKEMYNQMGAGVKKALFRDPKEGDEMFPNILQFFGSIGTTLAPITTMVGAITPLLLPLAPIITGIGMSVNMVMPHIARLIDGIQRVEILQRRFKFLGGSAEGGQAEFNYAKDMASKYNVPSEVAANSYSQLAIAARDSKMEGQGVKELFEGITASLSALGITGQDASLVFMAYTQILSKGKLSMEELRQQLGEKFPPAMGVFAKAMGVSIPEMNALVSSGGILSQDILPKVAKVLKEDYGDAAADQAGGLVVALNKLGNVGFEITTIFTDKLGGTLGFFVGSFADILGVLSGALKELIPLGQSFMIGFAATISIGLTILLSRFEPLKVAIGSLKNFLLATFSAITTNMMPMIIGVTADVADGWMGAEKNLMDNMIQGITNMFVSIFGNIDSIMRSMSGDQVSFTSMFGGLIQGAKEAGNIVEWLKGIFAGFFKIIPAGFVELLAMVFMFEQGTGLAVMALGPAIKGLWGGLAGMLKSIWGAFQGVMNSLKGLNELMMTSMGLANAAGHGAEEFTQRRVAALNATLAFLKSALMHVAIAYGILMFSKGDFSDPMRESINKNTADINKHLTEVRVNINKTTEAFNKATKSVSELGNSIRNALPAKGIQLDIRSLWGGGDWKWDDAVRDTNRKVEEKKSPGFMDVVGTSALAAGGVGAAIAAGSAITSSAAAAQTIIAANAALVVGPKAAIPLLGRFALALAPVVTAIGPIGLAIAGFVTALLVAAAALDLFAPKLTKEQYRELPQEIKDIINVKDYKRDRLDLASQQVIKLHKDQVLSNQRLAEFAKSVGLDGNINKFIAPPVKVMSEKQRKEFEKTDSANNINREITSTKDRLKGIENIGRTDVEKSAQRDKPIYKGVQEKLAQLEKNKRLLELQFMVNYGNKGEIDNLQNNIAKQTLVVKELQMREAQIKKEEIQFSVFGRPSFSGTGQTFKYAKKEQNYAEESQKLKALQQQKAQLQTNLNATVQRRLDFDQIKTIDVRLKKAVDEFINLDEQLNLKPNDELRSKVGLKKELIKQLRKQREKLLDSFGDPTPWLKKALKSTTDEIAQTQARADITEGQRKNIINNLRVRQEQLEKMLATVSKFGDISDLTGALYTKASNALRDAETKYNTDISKNKVASNQAQTRIYSRTNLTAQQIAPDLSNQQINDLAFQQKALEKSIATKITSLREYRAVLALGPSDPGAVQAEIDKLQQDILKDKEQISQNILDIAKARRDANQVLIDQTKQVAEYYRTSVREAETATIEYKKAIVSIRNQQFANRLRQALIGAGNNIVTEFVDTLINLFQQLSDIENINIDQQKQKLDYRNSIQDIEIKATELQRSLPGKIIPFDSNKINQYNQQLKGVGGTVLDINKEIQRINKILGMDAVNSTMGFNNALEKVVFTLTKIKNLAPSIPNPGDNIPKNKNNFYVPYKSINNPGKKPDPFNGLSLPTKSSNVPSMGAIASTPREMLVAGITSDVGYLPAVGKSPYLIAQATTPKPQQPKAIPSNAIVSPVSGKSISETVSQNYNKGWNWKTNQSVRIYGDRNTNVLSVMTGTLKKINNNTVELQRKINDKELRFRYTGLEIDENIKFNKNNVANVKAGQLIGKPIHDKGEGTRLFDFSVNIKEDGKSKYISARKFFNNIVELKRINPLTKFFNWATGNHIDPAVQGLNLAPQNVDPSWFKQVTSFMARPTMQNVERLQQAAKVTQKVVQSLQGKGSPNSSQGGIVLKVPAGKPTTKRKTTTRKTTTNPKPKTTTRKTTTNPKPKTVQEKSRELTERANRGGTDSPNNNQRNVTGATNIKAGATRQNTEAQIQVTEEQKRKAVIDFLRGLSTNTIKAQNDLDDANLRIKQNEFDQKKLSVLNNPRATEEQKDQIAYIEKELEFERTKVELRKRLRNLQAPPLSDTDFDRIQKELSKKGINVNIGFLKKLYLQLRSANAQEAATITANLRDLEKQRPQWLKDFAQQQRLQREVTKLNRRSDNLGIDTGVLQTQLGLLKQIETSRPLDPKVLEIPKIEYQLGIMQAEDEKLKAQANLTQLMKDKPGIFTPQDFKKRVEAIDKTYNLKLATLKLQFDTNDLSQKLKDEMNKLDAKIFLEEPTFKNLELQGKLFTATAAEGMVDLVNIYNQSLIDQRNATNRYEKEINETKGNRLLDEKQKDQRIKDIQENMALEKKVINETADRAFRKGTLQNQKLLLDVQIKMSDSAKALLEGRANIAKNLGLDLAAERIEKLVAQLNLANEYKQRKIQVEQDIESNKLNEEDADRLRKRLDEDIAIKSKAIESQFSDLDKVIKSFVTGFNESFKEFLLSTEDTGKALGELLKGIGKSVLNTLADIAAKRMTDSLFGWMLPDDLKSPEQQLSEAAKELKEAAILLKSAGRRGSTPSPGPNPTSSIFESLDSGIISMMDLGGVESFTPTGFQFPDVSQLGAADFGSLDLGGIDFSGFAKGGMITEDTLGKIENFANGGIIGAMSKERSLTGRTPHLVVASEGERILNHKETAIWNRLQSGVAGFADGGIVGGKGEIASRIGSTTTVNVPVSVSVSNDSEVDSNRLSQTIQALVSDGIRRELRPGGSIDRGNPYRR